MPYEEGIGKKFVEKLRRDGLLETARSILSLDYDKLGLRFPVYIQSDYSSTFHYQLQRAKGNDIRWKHIKPKMEENTSVLDIGCNAGLLTAKAATSDRFVIGLEKDKEVVRDAISYHGVNDDYTFINRKITPNNIKALPKVDYILYLSIHHQLHSALGQGDSERILKGLIKKAGKKFFFEAAGKKGKYNDSNLPFSDYDEDSIVKYNKSMLEDITDEKCDIKYISAIPRRDKVEGERYLFEVDKY